MRPEKRYRPLHDQGVRHCRTGCSLRGRHHKTVDKDPVARTGPLTVDLVSHGDARRSADIADAPGMSVTIIYLLVAQRCLGRFLARQQDLRTLIRRPREKLEVDPSQPKLLLLESGVGYRLKLIAV
jgi:DNA-binding response OmpR family regulator